MVEFTSVLESMNYRNPSHNLSKVRYLRPRLCLSSENYSFARVSKVASMATPM